MPAADRDLSGRPLRPAGGRAPSPLTSSGEELSVSSPSTKGSTEEPVTPTHRELVKKSEQWLLAHRAEEDGGWGEQPGRTASALNTAEVLLGLLEFEHEADLQRAKAVKAGAAYLTRTQLKDGPHAGAWARHVVSGETLVAYPDVIRTSLALQAVVRSDPGENVDCVSAAVRWLLGARNAEGLWGYGGGRTQQTSLVATCCATEALIAACRGSDEKCEADAVAAIAGLAKTTRQADGSFGSPGPFQAAHTMHAVLLLQKARECNVSIPAGVEDEATRWLVRRPPEDVLKMVEEQIELDPGHPVASYGFLHVPDTLAIRVLAEAQIEEGLRPQRDRLYAEAVSSINARGSDDGGFYGQRVLSWSTARAMAALWAARDYEPPQKAGPQQGRDPYIIRAVLVALFMVLAAGLGGYAVGMAGAAVVAMVVVLFALTLVGFGVFSEKGLVDFVKSLPKGLGSG